MKKVSLKLKITLWYTVAMLAVSAVLLFAMQSFLEAAIVRDIEDRVTRTVNDMARQMSAPAPRGGPRGAEMRFYGEGVHMVLYNENGEIVGGQVPFDLSGLPAFSDGEFRRLPIDGDEFCFYDRAVTTGSGRTLHLRGVSSLAESRFAGHSLLKTNLFLILTLILIAAAGGYFILRRAFVPVEQIRRTAVEIMESGDLSRRIALPLRRDEIAALAASFDDMLDKIEDSFRREQQFTSDASHELRTPIAVILSECEYLTDCAKTDGEFRESAAVITRQAERMNALVNQLLTLSRMDKNTLARHFEETDVSELLSFVCEEQAELHGDAPRLVREIAPDITARADRMLLARVFINLIENAYQYTPEDGQIAVSLRQADGAVCFAVADTGIGISEADLPKIWERFYQADPARSEKEGSMGLGLSMVKWIAACHGGEITVDSTLGEGSTFTFTFPLM